MSEEKLKFRIEKRFDRGYNEFQFVIQYQDFEKEPDTNETVEIWCDLTDEDDDDVTMNFDCLQEAQQFAQNYYFEPLAIALNGGESE